MKNKKKGKIKMALLKINNENFESEVLNSDKTVLLDFYADWCGPCQMVAPVLAQIAEEREDIVVGKINVDEEMQLALKFGVESIPMLAVIKDGKLISKSVGFKPKEQILELL